MVMHSWFRSWKWDRSKARGGKARRRRYRPVNLEELESRLVPAGTWAPTSNLAPTYVGSMLLLTDGSVMMQQGGVSSGWYKLTPDGTGSYINGTWTTLAAMSTQRLYGGTVVLPNGKVIFMGGEYSGSSGAQTEINTGEMYDPASNTWSPIAPFPQPHFGDDNMELLANGTVLAGFNNGPQTYIYNPATNVWSPAAPKLLTDSSAEESWVKLADGSILTYAISASNLTQVNHAQRYIPSTNTWVDAGIVPVALSSSNPNEIGPGLLLPDGRVFQVGATGNTALYTPSTNSWAAGPTIPGGLVADDAPGAVTTGGDVIFAADTATYKPPAELFDFNPTANTITQMTLPGTLTSEINNYGAYALRMLAVPSGEVLLEDNYSHVWDYNPNATTTAAWQPTITSIVSNGNQTYTLTGTQLNGLNEGASYGDDAQMASNFPIVRLTKGTTVSFAKTTNWISQVATGSNPVTTQFTLPAGLAPGAYTLNVIANGIASANFAFTVPLAVTTTSPAQNGQVTSAPTSFTVNFNEAVNTSFAASAFKVNGTSASGVAFSNGNATATFTFSSSPVTTDGVQNMTIAAGAITGTDGSTNTSFSGQFYYNPLTLAVQSTSPANGGTITLPNSAVTFNVTFNQQIDPVSAGIGNLVLNQGTVVTATVLPGNQTISYTIAGLTTPGTLTVSIPAGLIKDQYDDANFTAFSGSYSLVEGTMALPAFIEQPAYGSLIYSSSLPYVLPFSGNVEHFTLTADPGETITVAAQPTSSLEPAITLSDRDGNVLATAMAAALGTSALLQTVATTTSGTYTLAISGAGGSVGNYTLTVYIDAAVEAASVGIGTDGTLGTAQNLNSGFVTLSTSLASAPRAAAVGSDNANTHFYSFTLAASEEVSVGLKNLSGSGTSITLQNSSGTTVATGTTGSTNLDGTISAYIAPTTGTYYVVVSGTTAATYDVVITRDDVLDTEPHASLATAENVTATQGALGAISGPRSIRVGVQYSTPNPDWTYTLVNELNSDTEFSFSASAVTDAQMSTVSQLDSYDVILLADYGTVISPTSASALVTWVESGQGGLVVSAFLNANLDNFSPAATRPALEPIVPINIATPGNWQYSYSFTVTNGSHPVTQGITGLAANAWYGEAPKGGVIAGATTLATDGNGLPAIVVDQPGDGRSVWLDPSALSQLDFRVDRFQFCPGVADLHLPIHAALRGVHVGGPGFGFRSQGPDIRKPLA